MPKIGLDKAVKNINRSLERKQPASFDRLWIKKNLRTTFFFIEENIKNELGRTDWDLVVSRLDRPFQKRWMKGVKISKLPVRNYKNYFELEKIIKKYQDKLYTFISQADKNDRQICDLISIRLVRTAQKGNLLAKQKAITLSGYLVEQWIEDAKLLRWRGHKDLVNQNIENCIRRFRYAGSFLGYLYRTLEYTGRGLKPYTAFSLDEYMPLTQKRKVEKVVKNPQTGEVVFYNKKHLRKIYY
jgi:hypothetical protein